MARGFLADAQARITAAALSQARSVAPNIGAPPAFDPDVDAVLDRRRRGRESALDVAVAAPGSTITDTDGIVAGAPRTDDTPVLLAGAPMPTLGAAPGAEPSTGGAVVVRTDNTLAWLGLALTVFGFFLAMRERDS